MAIIVNDKDRLTYTLTTYGLGRVAEALADPNVDLNLFKIKIGDANGEFYVPYESMSELVNPIPGGEFFILDKELLEDSLTVCLHTVFPETIDNCEIREIGIYETVNGVDYLFAVSTQQPMLKPATELRYFVSVDYYAFIKSQNLADVYDQIILDLDDKTVTKEQLDDLMSTILFTESNLMEQINGNSRVIGLNRAQQLSDIIDESKRNFGYVTTYNNYTNLLNYVNPDDVYAYWVFDYPRRIAASASIVDISKFKRNFSTDSVNSSYARTYNGFMSMLDFKKENFFFLNQGGQNLSYNSSAFTVLPVEFTSVNIVDGEAYGFVQGWIESDRVDLTKDFQVKLRYRVGTGEVYKNMFSIGEDNNVSVALLVDPENYLSLLVRDSEDRVEEIKSTLKVNDDSWRFVGINYIEGEISLSTSISGENWEILPETVKKVQFHEEVKKTIFGKKLGVIEGKNYGEFTGSIDLKNYSLVNDGVIVTLGGIYEVKNELVFLDKERSNDIPFTVAYVVEANSNEERTILARSNYATSSHMFEITETAEGALKVVLFSDSSNYITFTSMDGAVGKGAHSVVFSYNAESKEIIAIVNGNEIRMNKEVTGIYEHMNGTPSMLYSFICRDEKVVYTKSETAFRSLFNADGTINRDPSWSILERQGSNSVVYKGSTCSYDESKNSSTDKLFAWEAIDGSLEKVYTKSLDITLDTILYKEDYTVSTAFELKDLGSGLKIVHKDSNTEAVRKAEFDIGAMLLYAFVFKGSVQTIWADDKDTPKKLYLYNGDLYLGTEWSVENNKVMWNGIEALYSPQGDHSIPSTMLTSYITGADGNPINTINSKIGVITVIKASMNAGGMRALALNLEATSGKNPCIYTD